MLNIRLVKVVVLLISTLTITSMLVIIAPDVSASSPTVTSGSPYNIDLVSNTTLNRNIMAENLTINSGVTLITNGYSIILSGSFINNGKVIAGYNKRGTDYANAPNYIYSAGGSGGGASNSVDYHNYTAGSTIASAGRNNLTGNGFNGSASPYLYDQGDSLNNSTIASWYSNGIQNYLTGANGASGEGYYGSYISGGYGSYGIYIQANKIVAGSINASGQSVSGGGNRFTSGAGGGGVIWLSFGSGGLINGVCNVSGGISSPNVYNSGYRGGDGGNGMIISYDYHFTPPVHLSLPHLVDGMYTTYSISYKESSTSSTILSISGTTTYTIENINILNQTVTIVQNYSVPGDSLFSGNGTTYTNVSLSQSGFYNPHFMLLNATVLDQLDNRDMSLQLSNLLGFESSASGIPLAGVVAVNTSILVPFGNYYADEISGHSSSGNLTYWISPSSGILLKSQTTQLVSLGYKLSYTQALSSTNIPSKTVPPPTVPYYLYVTIGIVVAVALYGMYFADKKGYIDIKKYIKDLSKAEREKNIKRAKIAGLKRQNLITDEEYKSMMDKIK